MKNKLKENIISITISLFLSAFITSVIILLIGKNPFDIFGIIISEVFGSGYGLGQSLFKATPLIITGSALAICFHASLFNIGAEGQLNLGAFVMSLAAFYFSALPAYLLFPVVIILGFAASAFWGYIPAIIKIKKGVSEVITTIMMNFIAMALINFLLIEFFAVKSTVRTEKIAEWIMIPKLSAYFPFFQGSSVNFTFFIALALAFAVYFMLYKTKFGYYIKAVGFNETAAKYIGIKNNRIMLLSFLIGSGLTSLVGLNFVLGYKGYYEFGFSNNLGFTAIAVALLAKNNPIGIIFTSLLFGMLDYGGLTVNTVIPKEIMFVVQAVVILSILSVDKIVNNYFLSKD